MKCGTTTLAELLAAHPDVCFCANKEPDFFSKNEDWRGSLSEYHAMFHDRSKLMAEASTTYTFYPHFNRGIWNDIHEYNPNAKLIYLYRDPLERCISQYMHIYERGYVDHSLEDTLRFVPLVVNNSRYAMQVKPYIERFGRDNVLLMDLMELSTQRDRALERISTFTGLSISDFPKEKGSHKNSSLAESKHHFKYDNPGIGIKITMALTPKRYKGLVWKKLTGTGNRGFVKKPELSANWQEAVHRLLESDIREFEKIVGRDLSHWLDIKV